jgi:hypothetical protein
LAGDTRRSSLNSIGLDDRVEDDPRLASLPRTPVTGLSVDEAARRRAAGLGNDADIRSGRTYLEIIRENALNPVNLLLAAIAGLLVVLGLFGDAAVTLVLVVVNVAVGFYQQARGVAGGVCLFLHRSAGPRVLRARPAGLGRFRPDRGFGRHLGGAGHDPLAGSRRGSDQGSASARRERLSNLPGSRSGAQLCFRIRNV